MSRGALAFVRENFIIVLTGFGDVLYFFSHLFVNGLEHLTSILLLI